MVTVSDILRKVRASEFNDYLAAELWLAFVLGCLREDIFLNPEREVEVGREAKFWEGLDELGRGRPLAQLTGVKEFYGIDFFVNDRVLVPRPESELLVDLSLNFIRKNLVNDDLVRVLDLGTGSGNIILAVAKSLSQVRGLGVDISTDALEVAKNNRTALGLEDQVDLRKGDLLAGLENEKFEIILANLPYIGTEKFHFVAKNVADFEPSIALFGGTDGLQLYLQMFSQIRTLKFAPKLIAGEFGFGQSEEMEKLLKEYFTGWNWQIVPDLAGIPRVFVIESAP